MLHFERYLSLDSYALVDAAPRESVVRVLDICCGSGVQGLVALRHYAKEAVHSLENDKPWQSYAYQLMMLMTYHYDYNSNK